MRTTTRGRYALKAMTTLAERSNETNPLALHTLAEETGISPEFLQQIFHRLRKAGLIAAYRGPGGGFFLAKEAETVSILEILEAAGESFDISPCPGAKTPSKEACKELPECKPGEFWSSLEVEMRQFASSKSLKDLMRKGKA